MPVLKRYSVSASAPRNSRKRLRGTIRCRYPLMRQIEQPHSLTVTRAGASTSKATAPQ